MPDNKKHSRFALLQYGLLALPLAFAGLPVYVHAPDFYAAELGVSITLIGSILLFLRIIDAVQDPLIGSLSDKFHQYRKYIMLVGMVVLVAGFLLLFNPNPIQPLLYFALGIFLCTTGFSIVSINLQGLGGLWKSSINERTRVTSWREAFGLVGLLLASIAPTILGVNEDPESAFSKLSILYIPLLAFAALLFLRWFKAADISIPSPKELPFKNLKTSWNIKFFAIFLCNNFASAIPAVLVIFFIRDRLDAEELTGLFLLLYFVSGAVSMPLWQLVAKKIGKYKAWLAGMLLAVLTFVWAYALGQGDVVAYGIVCVMSGLALGADLALPPSIIADRIADNKHELLASRYFSVFTFLSKAALALATGLSLTALGYLGYQPGAVENYEVTDYLSITYALIPCALKLLAAFCLWRFIKNQK